MKINKDVTPAMNSRARKCGSTHTTAALLPSPGYSGTDPEFSRTSQIRGLSTNHLREEPSMEMFQSRPCRPRRGVNGRGVVCFPAKIRKKLKELPLCNE